MLHFDFHVAIISVIVEGEYICIVAAMATFLLYWIIGKRNGIILSQGHLQ